MILLLARRGNTLGPGVICVRCSREIHGLRVGVVLAEVDQPVVFCHDGACLAALRAAGDSRQAFELSAFLERLGVAVNRRSAEWKHNTATGVSR